ncbi:hypothetical protein [Kitasatospora sp. NPDC093806]|uniref:hypothetical protein n=1 Tax=Kitasatospora sp. NPDC093806 TaxID=3155075 RepID=UPI00341FDEDC
MAAEDGRVDGFEEDLVVRLGARAEAVGGSPPLAELRRAGRRRARRRTALRSAAAVVAVLLGAGAVAQLDGPGGGAAVGPAAAGGSPTAGAASPTVGRSPSGSPSGRIGVPLELHPGGAVGWCEGGPGALRTPPSSGPSSASASPSPGASTGFPSGIAAALPTARKARDFGVGQYPEQFYGVCTSSRNATVYVMRVPGGDFDQAVRDGVARDPGVQLVFVDVSASRKALRERGEQIVADDHWRSRGVEIVGCLPADSGFGLVLYSPQAETARAEILAWYGAEVVEVVDIFRVGQPTPTRS